VNRALIAAFIVIALSQPAQPASYGNWTTDFSHPEACVAALSGSGTLVFFTTE
jgi:hypothetical protein